MNPLMTPLRTVSPSRLALSLTQGIESGIQHLALLGSRYVVRGMFRTVFPFQASGLHHLQDTPVIYAGNHAGLLDGPMLLSGIRQAVLGGLVQHRPVSFVIAKEVLDWPVIGFALKNNPNAIIIDQKRPKAGLKAAIEAVKAGHDLCIFPEGKLTEDGTMNAFNAGVVMLQQTTGVPVVPFAIEGGFDAWAIGKPLPKPGKLAIRFGGAILPQQQMTREETLREIETAVRVLKAELAVGTQEGTLASLQAYRRAS